MLPDGLAKNDKKASTTTDNEGNNLLARNSSLGQLQLDILSNHGLAEFLRHRDTREAKEASCLASSSFEEESRTPAARMVVQQGARATRGTSTADIDFRLVEEVQLQASNVMSETLAERSSAGSRRVQAAKKNGSPRGSVRFARSRSGRRLASVHSSNCSDEELPAAASQATGIQFVCGDGGAADGSPQHPTGCRDDNTSSRAHIQPGDGRAISLLGTLDSPRYHKIARTRSAMI